MVEPQWHSFASARSTFSSLGYRSHPAEKASHANCRLQKLQPAKRHMLRTAQIWLLPQRAAFDMSVPNNLSCANHGGRDPLRPPLRHRETHESTSSMPYAHYAFWIGQDPGFAIFRRFASLNALNLLALQAEISHEEHKLRTLQLEEGLIENHTKFIRLMEAEHGSNGW